ncbi:MAG: HD domain-containing protein [bacterium]
MNISDLQAGETLLGFYALRVCELIPFEKGVRLRLEFGDATGKVAGIMWNELAQAAFDQIRDAEVVKVQGLISTYQDSLQVKVDKIRPAKEGEYDPGELLPTSDTPVEELEIGVSQVIESVSDQELKRLLLAVIFDESIKPLYFQAPGGTAWHHPYIGGLAEHSLSMARAAAKLCDHYGHLDRSLLLAGALLHDIGKIDEMTVGSTLSYSTPGRLYGHIVMGYDLVREKARELELDEDENVRKLLHMILSHQGKKAYSVPVEPCFEEAFVLYFIDEMDSKLNAIARIRRKPENAGKEFSKWVNLLETKLYLGRKEPPEPEE